MARSGVLKSEIQKARDRLVAQGRNPSIDAVRAELGHTGSKTTIQRYLRELSEEEGAGFAEGIAVSDAIQDLVGRLAARLQEEADARIVELRSQHDAKLRDKDAQLGQQRTEIERLSNQLQRIQLSLDEEKVGHVEARRQLVYANTANERLTQQVNDLGDRLKDNEAHRQSLEEKHQHSREALEHYRQSVKDQREQEQRRHEHQVQQLQVEIRTLNQTVIVKQNELTQAYQDLAKSTAELAAVKKDIRRSELEAERAGKSRDQFQQRTAELDAVVARLTERLEQSETVRTAAEGALNEYSTRLRAQELELVELRTREVSQNELVALLKTERPAGDSVPAAA